MSKLNPNDFDYLSLEGGGGKGIVYLGAVKALEEVYLPIIKQALAATEETLTPFGTAFQTKSTYPLFPIWDLLPKDRPFKGISGSSAGAITAFMLAMGMTSDEIVEESKKTAFIMLEGEKEKVSQFETFYSPPDVVNFRSVEHEGSEVVVKKRKFDNSLGMITGSAFKAFIAGIYNLLSPIMTLNTTLKKVLFGAQTGVKKGVNPKTDTPYRSSMPGYSGIVFSRYMESLLNNFGLFSGLAVRTYFTSLIQRQLIDKAKRLDPTLDPLRAETLSFREFFDITGVDIVITGANVTQNVPLFFSVSITPDFPIIEAIGISMNIPILFKPVFVSTIVNNRYKAEEWQNAKYYGLWIDGGTVNNLPVHAFDSKDTTSSIHDNDKNPNYHWQRGANSVGISRITVCVPDMSNDIVNTRVLGLRLSRPPLNKASIEKDSAGNTFPYSPTGGAFSSYMGSLLDTLMYYSEDGQLRTDEERSRTIDLDCGNIGMVDFQIPDAINTFMSVQNIGYEIPEKAYELIQPETRNYYKIIKVKKAYEEIKKHFVTIFVFFVLASAASCSYFDKPKQQDPNLFPDYTGHYDINLISPFTTVLKNPLITEFCIDSITCEAYEAYFRGYLDYRTEKELCEFKKKGYNQHFLSELKYAWTNYDKDSTLFYYAKQSGKTPRQIIQRTMNKNGECIELKIVYLYRDPYNILPNDSLLIPTKKEYYEYVKQIIQQLYKLNKRFSTLDPNIYFNDSTINNDGDWDIIYEWSLLEDDRDDWIRLNIVDPLYAKRAADKKFADDYSYARIEVMISPKVLHMKIGRH